MSYINCIICIIIIAATFIYTIFITNDVVNIVYFKSYIILKLK